MKAYEEWREQGRGEKEEAQRGTEAALEGLKANFMCLDPSNTADRRVGAEGAERKWLCEAGKALDREMAQLSRHPLAGLPRALILRQAQQLLQRLQHEERVLEEVRTVCREVTEEWELQQEAMDDTGSRRTAMKRAVQSVSDEVGAVLDARDELDKV